MIFGAIARLRRLESRFFGQNGPRSSERRVYIEITRYIKNHQNFKILFWSWESEKTIFTIFTDFFTKKWAGNPGRESRVRRPGASSEALEALEALEVLEPARSIQRQHSAYQLSAPGPPSETFTFLTTVQPAEELVEYPTN